MNGKKISTIVLAVVLMFAVFTIFATPAMATYKSENIDGPFDPGSYHLTTSRMDIKVGETASNTWQFLYDVPSNQWGESCWWEIFGVYTPATGIRESDTHFTVDTSFSATNPEAVLHSGDIQVKRKVIPNTDRSFKIQYTITNTGNNPLEDVRFFEVVDYDVPDTGDCNDDNGWYAASTDYVWIKDDDYFQNGFTGDIVSSDHGMDDYYTELWSDWDDGDLNSANTYGPGDPAVGLQWDFGDIGSSESKTVTVTFWFGVPADDPDPEIPEFSTIVIPVASILGLLFFFNYRKRREE